MFEIEHRGLLTEDAYEVLKDRLQREAELLGKDDKEVAYYIYADKLLKAVHNVSDGTAKVSLKLTALGKGSSFRELEVAFPEEGFETMRNILDSVAKPEQIIVGTQKRTNYRYRGVEVALKWSEDWKYHVELEVMVNDESKKDDADAKIRVAAQALDIPLMTEQEVADFTAKIRAAKK